MENDGKLIWNESPVSAPPGLYSCIPTERVGKNGNDVEQGEDTKENCKPFQRLIQERKDLILFAEYSVVVNESKNGS